MKKFHPDNDSKNYNEAIKSLNDSYKIAKNNLTIYKRIVQDWMAAEKFRMQYCKIASKYC